MTSDSPAWLVARSALDYHDTVEALTNAAPYAMAYADDPEARGRLGAHLADELARAGLVLVPLNPAAPVTVEDKLAEQAASGWFGRED